MHIIVSFTPLVDGPLLCLFNTLKSVPSRPCLLPLDSAPRTDLASRTDLLPEKARDRSQILADVWRSCVGGHPGMSMQDPPDML